MSRRERFLWEKDDLQLAPASEAVGHEEVALNQIRARKDHGVGPQLHLLELVVDEREPWHIGAPKVK